MKISIKWLQNKHACQEALDYLKNRNDITDLNTLDVEELVKYEIKNKGHLEWANWLIVRIMEYKQYVAYAIYAAEQVIDIYETEYPNDLRPREAINAAKKCLKNPSDKNKKAVDAAAAASAAAYAASDAAAAAAAYAAAAAASAYAAVYAASAYAASDAAAAAASDVDRTEIQIRILKYGLKLLKGEI